MPCLARKYTHLNIKKGILKVYHTGRHTCSIKPDIGKYDKFIKEQLSKYPSYGPKKLTLSLMKDCLLEQDYDKWEEVAKKMVNRRRIAQKRREEILKDPHYALRNAFVAIADLKEGMDKKDKFLMFSINPKNHNNDPPYIFKSSQFAAKLANKMNCSNPANPEMSKEAFYFDVMYNRTQGFKTMTGWTYHAASRRVVLIATMEITKETTDTIFIFWKCMNKMLQELTKKDTTTFNPVAWMCDEHYANKTSIVKAFGTDAADKVITCEWHYKQCALRNQHRIRQDLQADFLQICIDMCRAETYETYLELKAQLDDICEKSGAESWAKWWDSRRDHIIPFFRKPAATKFKSNVCEIGHSSIKAIFDSCKKDLTVSNACMFDISNQRLQEEEITRFLRNEIQPVGKGPSQKNVADKALREERAKIKQYTKMIQNASAEEIRSELFPPVKKIMPSKGAKHKAPTSPDKGIQGEIISGETSTQEDNQDEENTEEQEEEEDDNNNKKQKQYSRKDPNNKDLRKKSNSEVEPDCEVTGEDYPSDYEEDNSQEDVNSDGEQLPAKRERKKKARDPDFIYSPDAAVRKKDRKDKAPKKKNLTQVLNRLKAIAGKYPESQHNQVVFRGKMPRPDDKEGYNPPILVFLGRNISTCQGCQKKFNVILEQKLCFQRQGYRYQPSKEGGWFRQHEASNIYFHCDMKCLKRFNPRISAEQVTADESTIERLTEGQQNLLGERGFIRHILNNCT